MLRPTVAALLAAGAAAWPTFLKCSIDSESRLVPGAMVMASPVGACGFPGAPDPCPVTIAVSPAGADGTHTINVTTAGTLDFAVRLNDGSGSLGSADKALASVCDGMMITGKPYPGGLVPAKAGSFALQFTPAAGKTIDDAVVTVGFATGPALPGIDAPGTAGVFVQTYPASAQPKPAPPPAPKPAGTPVMRLLDDQKCGGVQPASKLDEAGVFSLSITVAGDAGFAYNCSAAYDPAVGVAAGECIDWLPKSVLDAKEPLAITLQAADSTGKLGVCMHWELVYNATGSGAAAWRPDATSPASTRALRGMLQRPAYRSLVARRIAPAGLPGAGKPNNTAANRLEAFQYYLDTMTHASHKCVPSGQPAYGINIPQIPFFPQVGGFAWPPVAHTPTQMRVSHALLAATGTVWSIDRKCHEAWYIKQGSGILGWDESCVPTIPGFPHCHEACSMTWRLAPGGAASWGIYAVSHHIPAPAIALISHGEIDEAEYGDTGCGGATRP